MLGDEEAQEVLGAASNERYAEETGGDTQARRRLRRRV